MFERIDEDVNAMVEDQMNEVYNYFLDVFIENRKIDRKNALDLANGQVYVGKQAVNFGLIDKIGNIDNLLDYLNKKGIKTDNIVDYDISKSENNLINKFIRKNYKNSITNNKKLLLLYN